MKTILAIGDVADTAPAPRALAAGPAKVLVKTATASTDVRKAAGPAVWVAQADGSWAVKWRGNDTWWDLSVRYLQAGKRWRELFAFQGDAFHARVPEPIAIYTGALVAMPPEAVQRAQLLGEISGGSGASSSQSPGAASAPSSSPSPRPSPGAGPLPGAPAAPGAGTGSTALAPSASPAAPLVLPAGATPQSHLHWWILGALGVLGVGAIGFVAYRAHVANAEGEGRRG